MFLIREINCSSVMQAYILSNKNRTKIKVIIKSGFLLYMLVSEKKEKSLEQSEILTFIARKFE